MPRYSYVKLSIWCLDPRDFAISELRAAVEYLKSLPPPEIPGHVGLVAIAETVDAGPFKLGPKPMLLLDQIIGKTPAEVWELFDADVDSQREGLARRGNGHNSTSP